MAESKSESSSITDAKKKPKSGKSAARDLAFFTGGFFTGSIATVGAGILLDKVKDLPGLPADTSRTGTAGK